VEQRGAEGAVVPQRSGHFHDGVLHGDAADEAHARVLHGQVQRLEREHEARGGVAHRRGRRREAERRRLCPDHPHLQLLSELLAAAADERVREGRHHRRESGGRGRGLLLGLGLELLDALPQLGDVAGGVGEDGRLVHAGHGGHGGPELAEEAVQLVPPLPLRLDVAEGGAVGVVTGRWFPATPLQRSCRRFAGQVVVVAQRARALATPRDATWGLVQVRPVVVAPQPSLQEITGHELVLLVVSGGGERGWGRTAAG